MPTLRSKPVLIGLLALVVIALGLLYYFFVYNNGAATSDAPQPVALNTYVCDDESFYFVRVDTDAIEVAGARYELVSEESGMRYEGAGPVAFVISDTTLSVSFKETGEEIASCERGPIESTPIIEERNI